MVLPDNQGSSPKSVFDDKAFEDSSNESDFDVDLYLNDEEDNVVVPQTPSEESLLSGGDNKPSMLEKHLYDSWKSRMELYVMNRPHGRKILASVEKGPLVWPTITMDRITRPKEYTELTPRETIQADCDIKAINIILQGLPTKIYVVTPPKWVAAE
ncbi:hypothetical protein Tco_0736371 [Tanacetum coccineum]